MNAKTEEFIKRASALRRKGANDEQWEFATMLGEALALLEQAEQPAAGEFTTDVRNALYEAYGIDKDDMPGIAELAFEACDRIDTQQQEIERLTDIFQKIRTWQQAYPLDIFEKPDLKKAREVLKAAGMTLDAITADNMRYVLDGIAGYVEQALGK